MPTVSVICYLIASCDRWRCTRTPHRTDYGVPSDALRDLALKSKEDKTHKDFGIYLVGICDIFWHHKPETESQRQNAQATTRGQRTEAASNKKSKTKQRIVIAMEGMVIALHVTINYRLAIHDPLNGTHTEPRAVLFTHNHYPSLSLTRGNTHRAAPSVIHSHSLSKPITHTRETICRLLLCLPKSITVARCSCCMLVMVTTPTPSCAARARARQPPSR